MYLCSRYHNEIAHEGKICPVCELIEDNKRLQQEIEKLEDQINNHVCEREE